MIKSKKPQTSINEVSDWLTEFHDQPIEQLLPLSGGFWSSAYSYRVGTEELVLRLSDISSGFQIDQAAMRFANSGVPIPVVLKIGEALGTNFAISQRHYGDFLELVPVSRAEAVGAALAELLRSMRQQPTSRRDQVNWYATANQSNFGWHDWLRMGLEDRADSQTTGWRELLARNKRYDQLFIACEEKIESLLPFCPERRDLVHGDLLHQNVLVSEGAIQVSAIFSWKCSVLGDFLFDVAWCTLWGPQSQAIEFCEIWERTLQAPDLSAEDLKDASLRHHCYELQIAASHLGWNAWTGDDVELAKLVELTEQKLSRGPL